MSASPAPQPAGPRSQQNPPIRKHTTSSNIFNSRKRRPVPPGQRPPPPAGLSRAQPQQPAQQSVPAQSNASQEDDSQHYDEYPIYISKSALDAGLRFHAFKLQTKGDQAQEGKPITVDPYDETQFQRPLRLHRRFATEKMAIVEQSDAASGVDDKERELLNARRAERQAEREENQKLIAPTGGDSSKPVKKKPQKKVEEGRDDSNPVRKKRQQLRYEEARPWHLEDFEGTNLWVGSYEEALSESSIMLDINTGNFRVIPIEKWYKFIQGNRVNAMSTEDAEKWLSKKAVPSRWGLGTQDAAEMARKVKAEKFKAERAAERDDDDDMKPSFDAEFNADRDMLDMDMGDEFQDDDEGALYQGEDNEDTKDIERRLWLEMRDAALGGTGVKAEDLDPEEEERNRQIKEREEKKKARKMRKRLAKREAQGQYLSDSDSEDLWGSDNDESSDSETEQNKGEEERKKEEEAKKAAAPNGDKSGASSRGTNTPSSRPEKRPNPDASDLSGNESSRKRAKGLNGNAVAKVQSGARSLSPDAVKSKIARSLAGSGSGSDTDTSRTDLAKLKHKKTQSGSPPAASPNGSRAASPSAGGSRAQSPKPSGEAKAFPTLADVRAAIPQQGITVKEIIKLFKSQVAGRTTEFIKLVKQAGTQDKDKGLITPKTA